MMCTASTTEVYKSKPEEPQWLTKTIMPEEQFIYSVGHSRVRKTETDARDEALANATEEFVKYCRVEVSAFDRSLEIYSKTESKKSSSSDYEARSIIRAKAFVTRAVPEDWYVRGKDNEYVASVLLKVPKEEFERISKEKNIKLSIDVLFYYENEAGKMQILTEGNVLNSGDGYAIYVRPSDNCYLYVYQVDALGKSYRTFPNPKYKTANNPLASGNEYWIPNSQKLYILDETTGKENFYLFASLDKIEEFEGEGALSLNRQDIDNLIEIKKMGIAGVKQKRDAEKVVIPKHGQTVMEIKNKLQAEGAFVYETWFWHK